MSTVINTRSPYYFKVHNASLYKAKLQLYVWTGVTGDKDLNTDLRYTISKQEIGTNNFVVFELSQLIRDYMETEYNDYATDVLWVDATVTIYDSAGAVVQVGGQNTTTTQFLAIDGYGYFEDGVNPRQTTTPMVLQDNTTEVYYYDGQDIKIPIFAEAETVTAVLDTDAGANVNWNEANVYWDTYDVNWGDGDEDQVITDNGNTNQKIQYLIIIDTEYLADGDTLTISSSNTDYSDVVITLKKVNECKFSPLNIIFYNKYGALQNLWFFKKSMTDINVKSEQFKNNILDLETGATAPSYAVTKHEEKKFLVNAKESITINTGFYPEDHNEIIRQMMLAEQVWVDDTSTVLPINLKSNSLRFKKSVNDKLISYTVQFDYAFDKINNIS